MTKKTLIDSRPGKFLRFSLRLPIWLFRLHLDRLLGDRFLMLVHTGRKSGLPRQTVIEVVQHDKTADTYYVVSGWGEQADWYQNIRKTRRVTVHVAGQKFQSLSEFIPLEKSIELMYAYAHQHPVAFGELSGLFLGERMKPDSDAPERIARKMPMVAFHPKQKV